MLEQVVVFAHHKSVMAKLCAWGLKKFTVRGYTWLDGSTESRDRAINIERFNLDPSTRLIVVSVTAGATGVNLSAAVPSP